jgi:hypothetical protein
VCFCAMYGSPEYPFNPFRMTRLLLAVLLLLGINSAAQSPAASKTKKQRINWKQAGAVSLRDYLIVAHDSGFVRIGLRKQKLVLERYADTTRNVKTAEYKVKTGFANELAAWRLGDEFVVKILSADSGYQFLHFDFELNRLHTYAAGRNEVLGAQMGRRQNKSDLFYPIDRIYAQYEYGLNTYFYRKTVSDYSPTPLSGTPKNDIHYHGRFYFLWFDSQTDGAYRKKRGEKDEVEIEVWALEWTRDTLKQGYERLWNVQTGMDEVTAYRFYAFQPNEVILYMRGRNAESGKYESRIFLIDALAGKIISSSELLPEEGMEILLCTLVPDSTGNKIMLAGNYRWPIFHANNGKNGWFIGYADRKGKTRFVLQDNPDVPAGARKHLKNNPVILFHGMIRMPDGRFAAAGELMGLSNGVIGNLLNGYDKARKRDVGNPSEFGAITLGGFMVRFDEDLEGITRMQFDFNRIQRWHYTGYKVPEPHRFFLGDQNLVDAQYQHLPVYCTPEGVMQFVVVNPNEFRMWFFLNRRLMAYTVRVTPSRAEMEPFRKITIRKRRDARLLFYGLGAPDGRVWIINQKAGKKKAQKASLLQRKAPFATDPDPEQ